MTTILYVFFFNQGAQGVSVSPLLRGPTINVEHQPVVEVEWRRLEDVTV